MTKGTRIALVTGASSGIGRASALALAKDGFQVIITARRKTELLETVDLADNLAANILPVTGDVSNPDSVEQLFNLIMEKYGRLDLLFNNAGVTIPSTPTTEIPIEKWKYVMDVNVMGSFLCAQQALKIMLKQNPKGGRIINNGSVAAQVPRAQGLAYSMSKHAISGLTKSLCLDYREDSICCCQIDLGNAKVPRTSAVGKTGRIQSNGKVQTEHQIDVNIVAETIVHIANLPLSTNVPFMTMMALGMPFIGRG